MNRSAVALVFAALAACSASNNSGNTVTGDAGTTPTDVVTARDVVSTPTDTGTVRDTGTTVRDTGSGPADAGINFGRCGRAVISQLCACGNDQNCAQMAITGSNTCLQCVAAAQQTCCPDQFAAVQQCAQDNMCQDQSCLLMRCATQYNAVNTCLSTTAVQAVMSGTGACFEAQRGCLGEVISDTSVCGLL